MSDRPSRAEVAALRAFNRHYTRRLGLLRRRLDSSPFTLAEARILYELAHHPTATATDIAQALGVDRAQLSRTLKRFADRGLLRTGTDPDDARLRPLALTPAGRAAFAALDRSADEAVSNLLGGLPPGDRARLLSAARTISDVFEGRPASGLEPCPIATQPGTALFCAEPETTSAQSALILRALKPGDLGWVTHRQAVLYAGEYGWDGDYEALAARILADFVQAFDPAHDAAWIAERDGRVAGSVFLVRGDEPGVGKLRLLYVEPEARGRGVGAALVQACIARAREVGDERLVLWTNSVLTAARRVYDRAGFRLVDETPHRSFGKDLIGQTFELPLTGRGTRGAAA